MWLSGTAAHSALRPAGAQAARIHELWQFTLWMCMAVFALVLLALIVALVRAARRPSRAAATAPAPVGAETASRRWVVGATATSAVLLAVLLGADMLTDRALSRLPVADAVRIDMTAQQWWWEARYLGSDGKPEFAVASELHVPVGRPVIISLKSTDVIHTFWVPSLHGKKDMLPGRSTQLVLQADKAGNYRGECAEFCGLQHALMAFSVTVQSPEAYARWRAGQRSPAATPTATAANADAVRGQQLFMSSNCAQCHTVRGTAAAGSLGPDLTHVGSRALLAAGTVPNEPATLAAWIVDPQSLKPGSTMPSSRLAPDEVRALVAYLGGLQ
ncbi:MULTISPECIES: cytochrome c oxidase subunit II [unclassified Variovorax]|uniref:cytochrome c oxidase subunit II n=1 Tax=unclassified Variovorax TaxID=663243 RepID=UPI0008C4C943|nr:MULTISPECIES: cytochrome c oxidase subunit II [unclassified Variovorax]SEK17125.1 cytochrome c oxidase subunit 2 [Variovorax sp. OK202]SFE72931.1 cytochrome c oxidase subunit 2 [Variovorax sp. OK212]